MSREILEMELSGDALRAVALPQQIRTSARRAPAAESVQVRCSPAASDPLRVTKNPVRVRPGDVAKSGAFVVVVLVSGLLAYRFAGTAEPTDGLAEGSSAGEMLADTAGAEFPLEASTIEAPPVRFANPFDPDEVFEFPAGTSQEQAREKVADLLFQRAQERSPAKQRIATTRRAHVAAAD